MADSLAKVTAAAKAWAKKDPDDETRSRLQALIDGEDEKALHQAFGSRLAFGTAGLRGVMGVGPNNMNRLLIREATAGLGNYLLGLPVEERQSGVVIAYDGRHGSKDFARDAAGVLAAQGHKVYLFACEAPTPLGAFCVKEMGLAAGVVVTASHNPPEFNGYKVYRKGGTQINTPVDGQIAAQIDQVAAAADGPACMSLEDAVQKDLLTYLKEDKFDAYVDRIVPFLAGSANADQNSRAQLKIAYTPMHGVGDPVAQKVFAKAGFSQVWTVEEQRKPDGDFPTVKFPNPEEDGAMDLVHALADRHGAHIAIANDPDADRLSVSARTRDGEIKQMTGDQIGAILGDELLRQCRRQGKTAMDRVWTLSTIVSSRLLARLALAAGARHQETLTGFKWLGAVADLKERQGHKFLFAYEEALGYMVTNEVLDKDGLSALLLLSLLAAELHTRGETLWTRLEEVHRNVGLSVTYPKTIRLQPGTTGDAIMSRLRSAIPRSVAGKPVLLVDDLLERSKDASLEDGQIPRNDVIRFYIGTGSDGEKNQPREDIELSSARIIIRPSGTEPKVKIYCESRLEKLADGAGQDAYITKLQELTRELHELADGFVQVVS